MTIISDDGVEQGLGQAQPGILLPHVALTGALCGIQLTGGLVCHRDLGREALEATVAPMAMRRL